MNGSGEWIEECFTLMEEGSSGVLVYCGWWSRTVARNELAWNPEQSRFLFPRSSIANLRDDVTMNFCQRLRTWLHTRDHTGQNSNGWMTLVSIQLHVTLVPNSCITRIETDIFHWNRLISTRSIEFECIKRNKRWAESVEQNALSERINWTIWSLIQGK